MAHWVAAIRMWELSPWLGVGPGNYAVVYPEVRLPRWEEALGHAHNVYLNVLGESGLVGLAFFLALWVAVLVWVARRFVGWRRQGADWQAALAIGVIGVLVHLSVHNFFDNLFVQGMQLHVALWLALNNLARSPSEG
jgi:O-antigen ligase